MTENPVTLHWAYNANSMEEKLSLATARISLLEGILKRAVDGYNQAYCRDEVSFDWVEDAEAALGGRHD